MPRGLLIDTSIVRVHQHGACITRNRTWSSGSRGAKEMAATPIPRYHLVSDRSPAPDHFTSVRKRRLSNIDHVRCQRAGMVCVSNHNGYGRPAASLGEVPGWTGPQGRTTIPMNGAPGAEMKNGYPASSDDDVINSVRTPTAT